MQLARLGFNQTVLNCQDILLKFVEKFVEKLSLTQFVDMPTRKNNILDLVLAGDWNARLMFYPETHVFSPFLHNSFGSRGLGMLLNFTLNIILFSQTTLSLYFIFEHLLRINCKSVTGSNVFSITRCPA